MEHSGEECARRECSCSRGRLVSCIITILFCSAVVLNLWGLRRFDSCTSLAIHSTGRERHSLFDEHYPLPRLSTFGPVTFEAELFSTSVYKGFPRKELDEAWNRLIDRMCSSQHPMILTDDETLQKFDPTTTPTKGLDGHYYATVEIFHQLHCLDITRKFIWRDHYQHVDTFQNPPEIVWKHVDHCIDLLRQVLMCHSDIGLLFYTDLGNQQPQARVSTSHTCRNFSQIVEWVDRHDSELGIFADSRV